MVKKTSEHKAMVGRQGSPCLMIHHFANDFEASYKDCYLSTPSLAQLTAVSEAVLQCLHVIILVVSSSLASPNFCLCHSDLSDRRL